MAEVAMDVLNKRYYIYISMCESITLQPLPHAVISAFYACQFALTSNMANNNNAITRQESLQGPNLVKLAFYLYTSKSDPFSA